MSQDLAAYSQSAIRLGSKSFARAAMLFDRDTRRSVMMLYAWCRYCDDVIDGQTLGHEQTMLSAAEKRERLHLLRQETERVCAGQPSDIPAFAALAQVLKRHGIARRHLFELLEGFELDAMEAGFRTVEDTLHYCYHVAGVVGVMMASIMGVRDQQVMQRAADLGIAFQLTNIARDVVEDMRVGRCYLPGEWLDRKGIARDAMHEPGHLPALHGLACELVDLAEDYYASARIGITRLPPRCAWAISSALLIYRDIGLRLRTGGLAAWQGRTRISGRRKTWRLCHGAWMAAHAVSMGRARAELPRSGLWTKAET